MPGSMPEPGQGDALPLTPSQANSKPKPDPTAWEGLAGEVQSGLLPLQSQKDFDLQHQRVLQT